MFGPFLTCAVRLPSRRGNTSRVEVEDHPRANCTGAHSIRVRSVTKSNTARGFRYEDCVDIGTHRKRFPDQFRVPPLSFLPRSPLSQIFIDPVDLLQNLPSPRRGRWKVYGTRPTIPNLVRFGEEPGRVKDILRINPNGGREEPETAGPQAERKNEKATKKRVGMIS